MQEGPFKIRLLPNLGIYFNTAFYCTNLDPQGLAQTEAVDEHDSDLAWHTMAQNTYSEGVDVMSRL